MHWLGKEIKALNKKKNSLASEREGIKDLTAGHNTFISRGRRKRKGERSLSKIPMASQRLFFSGG